MLQMSLNVRKRTFGHMRLAKIQITLHIGTVLSENALYTVWIAKYSNFLHADNKNSDLSFLRLRLSLIFYVFGINDVLL